MIRLALTVLAALFATGLAYSAGYASGRDTGYQQAYDDYECVDVTDPNQWVRDVWRGSHR